MKMSCIGRGRYRDYCQVDFFIGLVSRLQESVLEAAAGVKPARCRAPLRAAGLDPRRRLQPRASMRSTPWCGSAAHRYRRIERLTCFQNTEAQHQQLAHCRHDDLFGIEATSGFQPSHQCGDRGIMSHR
jgi:hypothetical protein